MHWYTSPMFISAMGNLVGQFAHFVKQVLVARQADNKIGFKEYWGQNYLNTILSFLFSVAGQALLFEEGVMGFTSGFAVGMAADSTSDVWGQRAQNVLSK